MQNWIFSHIYSPSCQLLNEHHISQYFRITSHFAGSSIPVIVLNDPMLLKVCLDFFCCTFCCWSVESQQSYSQLGMMLKLIDSMFMGSFTPRRVCPFLKPADDPLCISFLIWWSSLIRVVLSAWSGVWRTRANAPQSPWYSCRSVEWISVIMEPFHFCKIHLCFTVILLWLNISCIRLEKNLTKKLSWRENCVKDLWPSYIYILNKIS